MSEFLRKPIVKTLMLKGQEGQSIKGITKTDTSGLKDTYTITLTDGTTSTFTVTNGEKGDTGSVSNLKIGGVNLLSGTKDFSGDWINKDKWDISNEKYNGLTVVTNKSPWFGLQKILEGKKGEKYTFSFYLKRLKQDGIISVFTTYDGGAKIENPGADINATDEWERYYHTFSLTSDGTFSPRVECSADVSDIFAICGYKLEREETPTDWTPALEDMKLESYPVGSIYISENSTSPAELFGGTWEQIKDRFLLGASETYSAGSTGGEATHTLTVNEMPSHGHGQKVTNAVTSGGYSGRADYNSDSSNLAEYPQNCTTLLAGGGHPHNNMPPYLAVYMWKRIA